MSMDEHQNNSISPPKPSKTNKHSKNPRRFSDDQIRSLESIFKLDTKLEPRKKLQIAKELGLQPRQVAIWFQNKRARWKSRQMEQEYKVLRTKYDNLHIQFDESKMENHSLKMQLEELRGLIKTLDKDGNFESKEYKGRSNEHMDHKFNHFASSVVVTKKMEEVEEEELLRWGEVEEISQLGSPEIWCNLSSRGLFDHSSSSISSSNWWEG